MKVHFVAVGENTPAYLNQLKLLLFSFRKNAGVLRDAPFTIVVNQSAPDCGEREEIEQRFDAHIRVMPRISYSCLPGNKYNCLYAVDEPYDFLVYLDCDTVILRSIDGIQEALKSREASFFGTLTSNFLVWRPEILLQRYGITTSEEVARIYRDVLRFFKPRRSKPTADFMDSPFPYFNSGVFVMSHQTVEQVRQDIVQFTHDLSLYGKRSPQDYLRFRLNRILTKYLGLPYTLGSHYQRVYSDALALSFSLIRHRVPVAVLDDRYNQYFKSEPVEGPASILHYTTRAYPLPREDLLTQRWVDAYVDATHRPEAAQLCRLIEEYISTY